jgi:uncharacterized C2H2 Zn-finger protein
MSALLSCTSCHQLFRSRSALNNHVRRNHQSSVKVQFRNGNVAEIKRGNDNAFKCNCGKIFKLPISLQKHTKDCSEKVASCYGDLNDVDMLDEEDDSDVSESCESDNNCVNEIPADCFGMMLKN